MGRRGQSPRRPRPWDAQGASAPKRELRAERAERAELSAHRAKEAVSSSLAEPTFLQTESFGGSHPQTELASKGAKTQVYLHGRSGRAFAMHLHQSTHQSTSTTLSVTSGNSGRLMAQPQEHSAVAASTWQALWLLLLPGDPSRASRAFVHGRTRRGSQPLPPPVRKGLIIVTSALEGLT